MKFMIYHIFLNCLCFVLIAMASQVSFAESLYLEQIKAQKLFNSGNLAAAKEQVKILPNILLPINIILGVIAIILGVTLRGY